MNPKHSKTSIRIRLIAAGTCLAFFPGCVVAAARDSLRQLDRNPANAEARRAYNFAVARIFTVVRDAKLDPWTQPMRVGVNGEFTLTWKRDPRPEWNLALYDLVPADELDFKGTYVKNHVKKDGIGAPLVAERVLTAQQASQLFCAPYIFYSVTATAQFEGSRCIISINDPLATETVRVEGHTYPLAANFTASYALQLAREKPQKLGLARLLRPQEYAATARIIRFEPYNPNKTVVLFIHGLMDTPVTWVPMLNDLRGDLDFRRNYQIWFYSYPSGYPYPYCATILRNELDAIEKKYPLRKPMVVVAHSMGGCITRTLLTDAGTTLWLEAFGHPPAQTAMDPQSKRLLEEVLIFEHRRDIGRVVFMSTPHRGSDLASNWIGRIGSMVVRTPSKLLAVGQIAREKQPPRRGQERTHCSVRSRLTPQPASYCRGPSHSPTQCQVPSNPTKATFCSRHSSPCRRRGRWRCFIWHSGFKNRSVGRFCETPIDVSQAGV